jgi:hypothetical protein
MDMREITEHFSQSLDHFINADLNMLQYDSSERAISHKLAEHMSTHFAPWDVDCEYNRIGKDKKRKLMHCSKAIFIEAKKRGVVPDHFASLEELQKSKQATAVFPDIIVHRRGNPDANLLVVEIKKASNPDVSLGWDQWKVQFLKCNLGYSAGVFVIFDTGIDSDCRQDLIHTVEWL